MDGEQKKKRRRRAKQCLCVLVADYAASVQLTVTLRQSQKTAVHTDCLHCLNNKAVSRGSYLRPESCSR